MHLDQQNAKVNINPNTSSFEQQIKDCIYQQYYRCRIIPCGLGIAKPVGDNGRMSINIGHFFYYDICLPFFSFYGFYEFGLWRKIKGSVY